MLQVQHKQNRPRATFRTPTPMNASQIFNEVYLVTEKRIPLIASEIIYEAMEGERVNCFSLLSLLCI